MSTYMPPELGEPRFTCPHCGAVAHQQAFAVYATSRETSPNGMPRGFQPRERLELTQCHSCFEEIVWFARESGRDLTILWPAARTAPKPHSDMPAAVQAVYLEADEVNSVSPRAAAALLRLALQVLLRELVPEQSSIDGAIGVLVRRGLDVQVQQAMDVVRVIGNNAVHPGQVKIDEDASLVPALFSLVNLIVEQVISRPKRTGELFDLLPQGARDAIERRDNPK